MRKENYTLPYTRRENRNPNFHSHLKNCLPIIYNTCPKICCERTWNNNMKDFFMENLHSYDKA